MTQRPADPPAPPESPDARTGPNPGPLRAMLSQPYRRLARGGSVHVYGSADGRYVLKALAAAADIIAWHASDGHALADLPWAQALGGTAAPGDTDTEIANRIRAATLASFRLANRHLRRESGLIHLHFPAANNSLPRIDCGDRVIDPGREPLVLQHRAERVDAALTRLGATGDNAACRQVIDDIVALVRHLWTLGIAEQTLNFHNNYGYIDDRLILLDIGDLCRSRELVMAHARQDKILHKKSAAWLRHRDPDLANYLAQQAQRCLSPEAVTILWQNAAR